MSPDTGLRNPYPGPRPFQPEERELFFGREPEQRELIALVYAHRVIFLYAQSGAGKTSLLNAAVCPALREEGFEVFYARHPGAPFPEDLRGGRQVPNVFAFNTLMEWKDEGTPPDALLTLDLSGFLSQRKHCLDEQNLPRPRVLVFDQFEEFFTAYPERWPERTAFFEQLSTAMATDPFLRTLIALREEYVASLDAYTDLLPERPAIRVRIEPLRRESALLAIQGPLAGTSRRFEEGVAEALVDRLDTIRTAGSDGQVIEVPGEFVEPVQLQVVCRSLWEDLPPDAERISQKDLESFGDVNQALSEFYEKAIEKIVAEGLAKEGELRQWFEHALITPALTRGMVFRDVTTTGGIPNEAVAELEKLHLVRGENRAGGRWYELTHDRLVEPVLHSNSQWRARHAQAEHIRMQLESGASAWIAAGRGTHGLLNKDQLEDASRWLQSQEAQELGVSESVLTFVAASREEVQKQNLARARELAFEQQRRAEEQTLVAKRLRLLAAGLIIFFFVALGFAFYSGSQRNKAKRDRIVAMKAMARAEVAEALARKNEDIAKQEAALAKLAMTEAQQQRDIAKALAQRATADEQKDKRIAAYSTSGVLADKAISNLEIDPERSLLLSLAGAFVTYASYGEITGEARDALNRALQSPHLILRLAGHKDYLGGAAFSPDGTLIATGSKDGTIQIWDAASGKPLLTIPNGSPVRAITFSPDASLIAAASTDKRVRIWDAASGKEAPTRLPPDGGELVSVAFSPDGQILATASLGGTAKMWSMPEGQLLHNLNAHAGGTWSVAFSPDGKKLATGGRDGTAKIWDVSSGKNEKTLYSQGAVVYGVAYSPEGRFLGIANSDNIAEIWDLNAGKRLSTLSGHSNWVYALAFSPDGTRLATVSQDRTARVWDAATGKELITLRGHTDAVHSVAFSPDGTRLLTASYDKVAIVWDLVGGPLLSRSGPGGARAVAFSPDGRKLAGGGIDGVVKIWDARTGSELQALGRNWGPVTGVSFSRNGQRLVAANWNQAAMEWNVPSGSHILTVSPILYCLAVSPDGRHVAVGGRNRKVSIWDIDAGKEVLTLRGHMDEVFGVAYSPNGELLATASRDGTAKLWEAATGKELHTLSGHTSAVFDVAFSPEGRWLATAGADRTAKIWDVKSGRLLHTLFGHAGPLTAIAFSPDAKLLALAGRNATAEVWNWQSKKFLLTFQGHQDELWAVTFSPDGKFLATAGNDRTVRLWSLSSGKLFRTLTGHTSYVQALAFSPHGNRLAAASDDLSAIVWEIPSGTKVLTLQSKEGPLKGIGYTPDGTRLVTASYDGTIAVWDAKAGTLIRPLSTETIGRLKAVAFSPHGQRFATGDTDGIAKIWDANSGKTLLVLHAHKNYVNGVAFSPDGKYLATASGDSTGKIWDATDGKAQCTLAGSTDALTSIAYNPRGDRVVTGGEDEMARVWDAASCKLLKTLVGHNDTVRAVAFSPDGTRIATAGDDKTVRLWDSGSGKELFTLSGLPGKVTGVAFSPGGKRLATASSDGSLRIFSLDDGELLALAERYLTRGLTREECENYFQATGGCPPEDSALALLASGNQWAKEGGVEEAVTRYNQAESLVPFLKLDPHSRAERLSYEIRQERLELETQGWLRQAAWFVRYGRVDDAIRALRRSQSFDSHRKLPAYILNSLCWWGSLWNRAADVLDYCEQAVKADPTDENIRDSRGVALVLTGHYRRAISDFEAFVAFTPDLTRRQQRERWLQALRKGQNPLTAGEIKDLMTQ